MHHILVVDDEKNYCVVLAQLLREAGYQVSTTENAFAALELLEHRGVSLILSDLKMPRMDGLELFQAVRRDYGDIPFIIMTAFATVETALKAIKGGVFDYLLKPFNNEDALFTIEKALTHHSIQVENQALRIQLEKNYGKEIIGQSPPIQRLSAEIAQVAQAPSPILITGETGVGKELVARNLHRSSSRSGNPWVAINCAALTETLLESEIFGHERGAFTGAIERKKGLVEIANNGTLFLDEIGELSPTLQPKLLRLLQEKHFRRVGGTVELSSNIRLVAATNRDLGDMVANGEFRQDLYYRLKVVELKVPPLREHPADIPLLAHHFLRQLSIELGRNVTDISQEALYCMKSYSWPGNIRELRNAIERGILFSSTNELQIDSLPEEISHFEENRHSEISFEISSFSKDFSLPKHLENMEEQFIRRALVEAKGTQARAASILGVSRSNLQYKLKKLGIE
jgi:two-component system, NtrC family, response regulator